MPKDRIRLIKPFKEMLNNRKTVSDEILDYARKKGFKKSGRISNNLACNITLLHSRRILDEIIHTRKLIEDLI